MSAELIFSITKGCDKVEDNYIISILGTQIYENEEDNDSVEVTTGASYAEINDKKLIKYREYDPDDGDVYVTNIIKIESPDKVTLVKRSGKTYSQLVLECGKRHQCVYSSPIGLPIGSLIIGIYTESIVCNIDENGGKMEINYTIDFNCDFQSENHLIITLTKKGNQ